MSEQPAAAAADDSDTLPVFLPEDLPHLPNHELPLHQRYQLALTDERCLEIRHFFSGCFEALDYVRVTNTVCSALIKDFIHFSRQAYRKVNQLDLSFFTIPQRTELSNVCSAIVALHRCILKELPTKMNRQILSPQNVQYFIIDQLVHTHLPYCPYFLVRLHMANRVFREIVVDPDYAHRSRSAACETVLQDLFEIRQSMCSIHDLVCPSMCA